MKSRDLFTVYDILMRKLIKMQVSLRSHVKSAWVWPHKRRCLPHTSWLFHARIAPPTMRASTGFCARHVKDGAERTRLRPPSADPPSGVSLVRLHASTIIQLGILFVAQQILPISSRDVQLVIYNSFQPRVYCASTQTDAQLLMFPWIQDK